MRRILTFVLGMSIVSLALFASIVVAPSNPLPGQEVQFTIQPAAGVTVVRVRWTFGDGSAFVDSQGPLIKHTFAAAGTYIVTASYSGPADTVTVVVAERRRITYSPAKPVTNVAMIFWAENFLGPCIAWDMGDGTTYPNGRPTQNHTYRTPGAYTVTAVEDCGRGPSFQTRVQVLPNEGPQAPFTISYIVLRFADGRTSVSVDRDFSPLIAYADLKFEGTGTLLAQWLVDGQPVATSTVPLTFANQTTIDSGPVPPLPTLTPGRHRVSLRILRPASVLRIPEIEYIVTSGHAPAPLVASAQPDALSRDKEYALVLRGREFTASTKFDFGSDLSVVSPPVVRSAEEAEVRVFVSRTAKDGERLVGAANENGSNRGPGRVRVGLAIIKPIVIKWDCPDLKTFTKGRIELVSPALVIKGNISGENAMWRFAPVDDFTVFKWNEPNAGAANFFELRFFDGSGKKLLFKKKLPAFTKSYSATEALIKEFFAALGPDYKPKRDDLETRRKKAQSKSVDKMAYDYADLQWEVAGLRSYDCPGELLPPELRSGASGWPQDVEIEKSDLWPLYLPDKWTGLNCPASGYQQISLNAANLDREKLKGGQVDKSNYVGHCWELTGKFDTRLSPLGSGGTVVNYPPPPSPKSGGTGQGTPGSGSQPPGQHINVEIDPPPVPTAIQQVDFSNTFVDWGDGSPVEAVSGYPDEFGEAAGKWDLKGLFSIVPIRHAYAKTGVFTIRLYQLPDNQLVLPPGLQLGDADLAIREDLGNATNPGGGGLYSNLTKKHAAGLFDASGAMAGAFMMYCQNAIITDRMDLCANGPLNLTGISITGFPGHDTKPGLSGAPAGASASTCDEMMTAKAELTYYGRGSVDVTWFVKGENIGTLRYSGLSSPNRKNLDKAAAADCSNAAIETLFLTSPTLPVEVVGTYDVVAEARVVFDLAEVNLGLIIDQAYSHGKAGKSDPASAGWIDAVISGYKQQMAKSPSQASQAIGQSLIGNLQAAQAGLGSAGGYSLNDPPLHVVSPSKKYIVNPADPKSLCVLLFPTKDGIFRVCDVQNKLTKQGDRYSGQGILKFPFTSDSDSVQNYPVPVTIKGWLIQDQSGLVLDGALDEKPGTELSSAPGVNARLVRVAGQVQNKAENPMNAELSLGLRDQSLRKPGNPETPPEWKSLTAALSNEGDWIKKDALPEILVSWTGFRMSSPALTFDFSKKTGAPAQGLCAQPTPAWVGVDLGPAVIIPYTFDLVTKTSYSLSGAGWVVAAEGLCGQIHGGPWKSDYKNGSVAFESLDFRAKGGSFTTSYNAMVIHVPWLETDLKGTASLLKLPDGFGLDFSGVVSPTVKLAYGQFILTASNLRFTTEKNIGWVIDSTTDVDLKSENKPFSHFVVDHFFYGFDGRPYFNEGERTKTVPLSGKSSLGDSPLDLVDAFLAGPASGSEALNIAIHTKTYLSENPIIPAASVQVNYQVSTGSPVYTGTGPWQTPFDVNSEFPIGQPVIKAKIRPAYSPGTAGQGPEAQSFAFDGPSQGPTVSLWQGDGPPPASGYSGTRYYGDLDLGMFGGPPFRAQFLLGYQGGKTYFLMRGDVPLGPSGIPMSPIPFTLFQIMGGLGYNFPVNAFKNASLENAQPDMAGSTLFMAGMRIGSSDGFTFTLDGTTTVKTSGEARMDFDAWILTSDHSGDGQFQGMFQFAGGSFDGRLWGGLDMMGGLIKFSLGTSETDAAFDLHFDGGGNWHFYAGKKDGPRIRAVILTAETDSYMMLGSDTGLAVGGAQSIYLGIGDGSVASAYVKGYMDIGLQIAPGPRVSGDFAAGVEAGVCAFDTCVSASLTADIHAEAPPLSIVAHASLDLPWPLPSVSITVHM